MISNLLNGRPQKRTIASFLCVALMLCSISVSSQESAQYRTLQVDGPRALAEALVNLMQSHPGIVITYEDIRYRHSADLQGVAHRLPGSAQERVLVPRNSSIRAEYSVLTDSKKLADPAVAIARIVDAYNTGGNPGTFKVERSGAIFHVIPESSRDTTGKWVTEDSILELAIDFDAEGANGLEVLEQICEQLSAHSGHVVGWGVAPVSLLVSEEMGLTAYQEKARDVLVRFLGMFEPALTWQLNFDPTTEWYFINLLPAEPPRTVISPRELDAAVPAELDPTSGSIFRIQRD